jgi:hypothetical protein
MDNMTEPLYHEKQWLGHCAVHALNNLFQEQLVDYDEMCGYAQALHANNSERCLALSVNPYKSCIPYMGYFDISVIIKALDSKQKGKISEHITMATDVDALELSSGETGAAGAAGSGAAAGRGVRSGFIVNVRQGSFLCPSGRHWFGVLQQEGGSRGECCCYWNLDSKLQRPASLPSGAALKAFFKDLIHTQSAHIFVVTSCFLPP